MEAPRDSIEALFLRYPNGIDSYLELHIELAKINTPIKNIEANSYIDLRHSSPLSIERKEKQLAGISKFLKKSVYYGIVLYSQGIQFKEVYIDVPGLNSPLLDEEIFYKNELLDLDSYKEYLFRVEEEDYVSNPVVGGIAVVKIPENYPNHIYTNPEEAVYLSMKRKDPILLPNKNAQKINKNYSNKFNAQNSSEG